MINVFAVFTAKLLQTLQNSSFHKTCYYSGPVGARVIKEVRFQFFFFPVQQNAQ